MTRGSALPHLNHRQAVRGFEATVREYYGQCEQLARALTCAMSVGLGLPPEALVAAHFDRCHSR